MTSKEYEEKAEVYSALMNLINEELEYLNFKLESYGFSFNDNEDMVLEKFNDFTYKLTFKRTEFSKEHCVCIAMKKAKFEDSESFYITVINENEVGFSTASIACRDVIKRFVDRIIDTTKATVRKCDVEILKNKYYSYREKIERME